MSNSSASNFDSYARNMLLEFQSFSAETGLGHSNEMESNEIKLLCLYAYYNFFHADASSYSNLIDGLVRERESGHSIAAIYIDEESDNEDIVALIPFFTNEKTFSATACIKWCVDAEVTLLNKYLCKTSKEAHPVMGKAEGDIQSKNLIIRIVTNYAPKSQKMESGLRATLRTYTSKYKNVTYEISFWPQIESDILEIENPREYVESAIVEMDTQKSFFKFSKEESIVVNISAKSIKALYEQHAHRGLFAQNLRYYIKNAKIDANIVRSIKEYPENFWYYNNGLILICDGYTIYNNRITLKKFSIVNGGQTTKLIGETDFEEDFYVLCKVIKNRFADLEKRIEFIANVAEASNTQKPIKTKDLIANRVEQRNLKRQLLTANVYCQIKRGEKVNKKLFQKPWQNTTNEELGQMLLAFVYQLPGSARNAKSSISGDEKRYNLIFGKTYNTDFLVDILKLKAPYKKWEINVKKNVESDSLKIGLVGYGRFFILAIIGVLAKMMARADLVKQVFDVESTEQKLNLISQNDIDHHILIPNVDDDKLFTLFEYCYKNFYRPAYNIWKSVKPTNEFSNYTKSNVSYNSTILPMLTNYFKDSISDSDLGFLKQFFHIPSEVERQRNQKLLELHKNVINSRVGESKSGDLAKAIKKELTAFSKVVQKKRRMKSGKVFSNEACICIAQSAPQTFDQLSELSCLDKSQLARFGNEIVEIVKKAVAEN